MGAQYRVVRTDAATVVVAVRAPNGTWALYRYPRIEGAQTIVKWVSIG
jgi:hypothetical protein